MGSLSWPFYKVCEPHVVIVIVTALAIFAASFPPFWLAFWRAIVLAMALLAPALAAARLARSILRGSVETEFAAWFEPWNQAQAHDSIALSLSRQRPLDSHTAASGGRGD